MYYYYLEMFMANICSESRVIETDDNHDTW